MAVDMFMLLLAAATLDISAQIADLPAVREAQRANEFLVRYVSAGAPTGPQYCRMATADRSASLEVRQLAVKGHVWVGDDKVAFSDQELRQLEVEALRFEQRANESQGRCSR